MQRVYYKRKVGCYFDNGTGQMYPDQVIRGLAEDKFNNIKEADTAILFHLNSHLDEDVIIHINDGDAIALLLLHSRERMNRITGEFNKTVYIYLPGKDPVYINVNELFLSMQSYEPFVSAGVQDPVMLFVLMIVLSGTDFFGDLPSDEWGFLYGVGKEKFMWNVMIANAKKYSHMIQIYYGGGIDYAKPNMLRVPILDEKIFQSFVYDCYCAKAKKPFGTPIRQHYDGALKRLAPRKKAETEKEFKKRVKKLNAKQKPKESIEEYEKRKKKAYNATPRPQETIEAYQARRLAALRKRVPPEMIIARYGRIALLNILYWFNDYRLDGQSLLDPTETHMGLPYFGFILRNDGDYVLSPIISPPKPIINSPAILHLEL